VTAEVAEVVIRLRLEYAPGVPPTVSAPADNQPLLYPVEDAAKLLSIGESLLWELVSSGEVESLKIGRNRRISLAALQAYIAKQAGGSDAPAT
jgi:excisionase family DNA binding protein